MVGVELGVSLAIPGLIDLVIKYSELLRRKVHLFMNAEEDSKLHVLVIELTTGQINELLGFFNNIVEKLPDDLRSQLANAAPFTTRAMVFIQLLAFKQTPMGQMDDKESRVDLIKVEAAASKRLAARLAEACYKAQQGPSIVDPPFKMTKLDHTELQRWYFDGTEEILDIRSCPRSLPSLLTDPINSEGTQHSLSDRFRLAQTVAKAVLFVHSSGFVHKNIRPENIIILVPETSGANLEVIKKVHYPFTIGRAYLAGYDGIRKNDASSARMEEQDPVRRLYLPPERLCANGQVVKFSWKHDIYSLGVVLMEIVFWTDFTTKRDLQDQNLQRTENIPSKLRRKYLPKVSWLLGDKYHDAVRACLNMLKGESAGETIKDEDGLTLGVSYISQILDRLETINL
ncbi:hypothetical protein BDV97DRAFT_369723 [Delphinella strobiligena]|nr:hypothetical protein BDV97DRAFT_369723 [Delphinella strobiligena]